jgi:hypothetical protein
MAKILASGLESFILLARQVVNMLRVILVSFPGAEALWEGKFENIDISQIEA